VSVVRGGPFENRRTVVSNPVCPRPLCLWCGDRLSRLCWCMDAVDVFCAWVCDSQWSFSAGPVGQARTGVSDHGSRAGCRWRPGGFGLMRLPPSCRPRRPKYYRSEAWVRSLAVGSLMLGFSRPSARPFCQPPAQASGVGPGPWGSSSCPFVVQGGSSNRRMVRRSRRATFGDVTGRRCPAGSRPLPAEQRVSPVEAMVAWAWVAGPRR
jgi:hypothetical protein